MDRFKLLVRIIVSFLFLAVPFFFSTVVSEYFELPKLFLIYGSFLICLLLLGFKYFVTKQFKVTKTPFDLPLFLLLTSLALSTYFGANRVQSAMNGLAPLSVGILFYFLIVHLLDPFDPEDYRILSRFFILTATLLGLLSFLSYFNLHLFPFDFARNRFFTPMGSNASLIIMMALSAPLSLSYLLSGNFSFKSPWYHVFSANLTLFGLMVILQTSVLGLLVSLPTLAMLFLSERETLGRQRSLLTAIGLGLFLVVVLFYIPLNFNARFTDFRKSYPRPINLDGRSSWVVSIQTIRDYPIFGSGPATFLSDFVRYRPAFLNYSPNWFQRFTQAAGEPYQVLATTGLLGFVVFLILAWKILKTVIALANNSRGQSDGLAFSLLAFLIALLFSVPSASLRVIFFVLLALYTLKALPSEQRTYPILPTVPPVVALILTVSAGYLVYVLLLGELSFKRAIDSAVNNDTQGAINGLNAAVGYNPYRDNYHLSFASLTYTLANNLAARPELTDTDRQTLAQLINAAVSEAKTAVTLDPFNGANLETLASIYHNIAGAVENAATWAVTAYQQAIQIDPSNPELRFKLGSLLYAAGNYEAAANYFAEAIRLKNDQANYHYNLAWTLRNQGILGPAIDEMTIVSRLVPADSGDGQKVLTDLADFQKLAAEIIAKSTNQPSTQGQTELEIPRLQGKLAEPTEPKVNLPAEASPSGVKRK